MKIAIRSHEPTNGINGYGGLEQRLAVMWGYVLEREGHDVHYYHESVGCDDTFDLAMECPSEPTRSCCDSPPRIRAKRHIHSSYGAHNMYHPEITISQCYQEGKYILSVPHRQPYTEALGYMAQGSKAQAIFLPLPYPDELMPQGLQKGFDRTEIWWGNKGNFDAVIHPQHPAYQPFVQNGINTLKALVKLNQKVDFKITFLLTERTKEATSRWPEWGVEELIGQLKQVERLNIIPWTELVQRIGKCKLNTHPGGLTSSVHETIFTHGVPVTPKGSAHMFLRSPGVDLIRDRSDATVEEIYDTYERLWFDEKFYNQVYEVYQDSFTDHRSDSVKRWWKRALEILEIG